MKSLLRRRPSPALVIALIALFVSLSGVSYGVATGFIDSREIKNNEVRSVDIRNNQIRTRDLRNNEIRGIDIRNSTVQSRDIALNAVTGDDVKEETLQKVPSAMLADTATNATSATTAESVNTLKVIPLTAVPGGAEDPVVLATHGPLRLLGECGSAASTARLLVDTSEDNSSASGGGTGTTQNPDVDADDDPVEIAEAGGMALQVYVPVTLAAFAPSGKGFSGDVAIYRNQTTNTCRFHGSLALQG